MSGRATLKDVASMVGVSVSTVSLVLAGKGRSRRISAEMEERIHRVAREQGYSPNRLVHSLQQGRTNVIAFYNAFGQRERGDLYVNHLSAAIEYAAGIASFDVLVHCNHKRPAEEAYQCLNGGLSDGLLFFGPQADDPLLPLLRLSRLPTVLLDSRDEEGNLSSVVSDMQGGMRLVVARLLACGHLRIAAITSSPSRRNVSHHRVALLKAYLAEAGVELPEERVIPVYNGGPCSPVEAVRQLLALPAPPTAIFIWHDRVGYQILEACEELGVAVPEQLALVGYDGLHWPSTSAHILASVEVDLNILAETGVRLLAEIIQGKRTPQAEECIPVRFSEGTTLSRTPTKL